MPGRLRNQKLGLGFGAAAGALVALGVIAVLVAFGARDSKRPGRARPLHPYTLRWGDVVLDPRTGTRCVATGEAGIPNLTCRHVPGGAHEAVFWSDELQVYGPGSEPMDPKYSFKWWASPR